LNKILLVFLLLIISNFSGCGYKPTSHYAKHEISGLVFVELKVDINNATNSVLVKDAVNEMVVNQFGASLINKKNNADTLVLVSLRSVSYATLQDDKQGYAKLYRTKASVNISYKNKNINRSLSVTGSYDYSIDSNTILTDAKKQESVKIAVQKALSEIFSTIAIQSFKE